MRKFCLFSFSFPNSVGQDPSLSEWVSRDMREGQENDHLWFLNFLQHKALNIPTLYIWEHHARSSTELVGSRKHVGFLLPSPYKGVMLSWAESCGATTVHFLLLQVTSHQGDPQGNKLPQLHIPKTGTKPSLAGRSQLRVAPGQGLPGRGRWNMEAVTRGLGDKNQSRWRDLPRGGRRTRGLPSRIGEHLQRRRGRLGGRRQTSSWGKPGVL